MIYMFCGRRSFSAIVDTQHTVDGDLLAISSIAALVQDDPGSEFATQQQEQAQQQRTMRLVPASGSSVGSPEATEHQIDDDDGSDHNSVVERLRSCTMRTPLGWTCVNPHCHIAGRRPRGGGCAARKLSCIAGCRVADC